MQMKLKTKNDIKEYIPKNRYKKTIEIDMKTSEKNIKKIVKWLVEIGKCI